MPSSSGASKPSPSDQSDRLDELLQATAKGDRVAFDEVYRLTASKLLGIAVKMLSRRELAEEVLQEAFLTVWQKADQFRAETGSALGWLVTIVRHRAIDRLRSMGSTPEIAVGTDADLEMVSRDHGSWTEAGVVVERTINHCLEQLKIRQRRFIQMAFFYGLTHEELSARTGAPLGTVKSEVRRGLKDLRSCLEQ